MTDLKTTPGPWHVELAYKRTAVEAAEDLNEGCVVAECYGPDQKANAHLIAAAPDLYEALAQIVYDWDGEPEDMFDAQAALAKSRADGSVGDE